MATVTLDIVVNETDPATAEAAIEEFRASLIAEGYEEWFLDKWTKFEPVTDRGPGGGWPVIRVSGEDTVVYGIVKFYTGGDEDEADFLFYRR